MSSDAVATRAGGLRWRLLAIVPIALLVLVAALFVRAGGPVLDLVGTGPPPADVVEVRRVEFRPGEIRVRVRNPQPQDLTVASVTVDDAVVPFSLDGSATLSRLATATLRIPFTWVEDDPYTVGVTTSTGIETVATVAAAVETADPSGRSAAGYALIGALVGIVPVALGMLWLPSLRRVGPRWLIAFMALTAGLLTFLAVDALGEALALQAALPGALGGTGLLLIGVAVSYLGLTFISQRLARRTPGARGAPLSGVALATMVAVGIGVHNLGEGLAIGTSFALGELTLGSFLILGFMVHNVTEGLGIAAPISDGGRPLGLGRASALVLVAGAPAILGAWIGGFLTNEILAVLFFSIAVGAAAQVVVEVGRFIARRAEGGFGSGWVVGGFLTGLIVMYLTGLLVG